MFLDTNIRTAAICAAASTLMSCGGVSRNDYYWENSSLRHLPQAQYDAAFRGHTAQCQANAAGLANQAYPAPAPPPSYQSQFSGQIDGRQFSGSATSTPTSRNSDRRDGIAGMQAGIREADRQALTQNAFTGCMMQYGWVQVSSQQRSIQVSTPNSTASSQADSVTPSQMKGNLGRGEKCIANWQCLDPYTCDGSPRMCR